ncbi:hypothetical protein [Beggiatoa leptomitoformis]|uniref:Uncharacterized protein n=1 Tax=Beggiatoa leptomitoformis TaxID=288004 RepID=A0A650GDR8_9GAMM|nr:hypothetical protein [Beggiatoa leptomitoformis]QGX03521.1 hypothetical protein AL038_18440 [Beggiatoa leptomitoformis]QGX04042.1 hypothetical protein BLE401_18455 [Beggiatoa leptomitoformis]
MMTENVKNAPFDPQVQLHIKLSFAERAALKKLATAQGLSIEKLLQQQIKQLLENKA